MEEYSYALTQVGAIWGIGVGVCQGEKITDICSVNESNPLYCSRELRELLIKRAVSQENAVIYQDAHEVCFGCVKKENRYVMLGPMALKRLNRIELHRFSRQYEIDQKQEKSIHKFTAAQIVSMVGLVNNIVTGRETAGEELMRSNHINYKSRQEMERAQIQFALKEEEAELYHHTYMSKIPKFSTI
ncbi:MAG: hypothetical protein Q4C91_02580 [Eubacteriales bacterium]|nr:hypothetical protein [Eubacteriales bacterium]